MGSGAWAGASGAMTAADPTRLDAQMTVRRARAEDLPQVAAIERESFTDPWSIASFRTLLAQRSAYFAVASRRDEGPLNGYIVAWCVADEGEIANVAVTAEARGRGVGAALLDAALRALAGGGAASVHLEVRDSNRAARALYATRGFEEVGRRRGYYRRPVEDALVLRRLLEATPAPGDVQR